MTAPDFARWLRDSPEALRIVGSARRCLDLANAFEAEHPADACDICGRPRREHADDARESCPRPPLRMEHPEPPKPEAFCATCGTSKRTLYCGECWKATEQKPEAQAVAWMCIVGGYRFSDHHTLTEAENCGNNKGRLGDHAPLFTSPPATVPREGMEALLAEWAKWEAAGGSWSRITEAFARVREEMGEDLRP